MLQRMKENRKKKRKVSYVKQHFIYLFLFVVLLACFMGITVIHFSKNVVGNELIKLHQALIRQSTSEVSSVINGLKEVTYNIAEDANVTDFLSENPEKASSEDLEEIERKIRDEIYLNHKSRRFFRIYLYDLNELRYASDSKEIAWNDAIQGIGVDTIALRGPIRSKEEGLYRYSYYLTNPVRDLLTGEIKGYVLLQFCEEVLHRSYSQLRENDRKYFIIDENGYIVSGEDKRFIGDMGELPNFKQERGEKSEGVITINEKYMYFYETIFGTSWYFLEKINVSEIWESIDKTGYFLGLLILIFVSCIYPITLFFGKCIVKPVDKIKNKMNEVAQGNLSVRISAEEKGKGEFSEIADSFNYMVDRLEKQVSEIKIMEQKKHLLELDFLRTQINPHFIYNTLSSIRFYVEMGKNEEAEDMLIDFSKILRKTLSKSETMVSLKEELQTLKHYVNLQKARYRDRFEMTYNIDETTLTSLIPDFILQPIVENAIFYSLREDHICHIEVKSYKKDDLLYVSIKDDGIGMNQEKILQIMEKNININKVGIRNVNERLKLNFGDDYGLQIKSEEGTGTEVVLIMPFTSEHAWKGKSEL